jgi:hypothetical protein
LLDRGEGRLLEKCVGSNPPRFCSAVVLGLDWKSRNFIYTVAVPCLIETRKLSVIGAKLGLWIVISH